jgi:ubiquinone/menaquinone biosynthesis C-methylase UbiE
MKPWYEIAFSELYLDLYAHRDLDEARRVLDFLFSDGELAGARVADVACGAGRYLGELRRRGAWALGLDLSPWLLKAAREEDPDVPLVRADMRAIPLVAHAVDWSLSLFTSFGYFQTVEEHGALARELARIAGRGVFVDIPNPTYLEKNLVGQSTRQLGERRIEETRRLQSDPARVLKRVHVAGSRGETLLEYEENVMLFTLDHLTEMFRAAGLRAVRVHGDYDGSAFAPQTSPREIVRFEAVDRRS